MSAPRLYRGLLAVLPTAFRNELADEMAAVAADRWRAASGPLARARLWLEWIPDLVATASREHAAILARDLRIAVRGFRREPTDPILAVATLALALGANVALFSAVDRVYVRGLPYPHADRLVQLWERAPMRGYGEVEPAPANVRDWIERLGTFDGLTAWRDAQHNLTGGDGPPERLEAIHASGAFGELFGVTPLLGRRLVPADDDVSSPPVVLIAESLWHRRFGAARDAVGSPLALDGTIHEVVGVLPSSFAFPDSDVELWLPLRLDEEEWADRTNHHLEVVGRLASGVDTRLAQHDLDRVATTLDREYPDTNRGSEVLLRPLREQLAQGRGRALVLSGLAALGILALASANLAGLALARAARRRRELAVRTVLGAGREHLLRQLLTENAAIVFVGAVLGWMVAPLVAAAIRWQIPSALANRGPLATDGRAFALGVAIAGGTALAAGAWPAWRAARAASPSSRLVARSGVARADSRLRGALAASQIAIATVLVFATLLLLRALDRVGNLDPGFRTSGIVTARTALAGTGAETREQRESFYTAVLDGVRRIPGVRAAGYTGFLPFTMRGIVWPTRPAGAPDDPSSSPPLAVFRIVTEGYLETLEIPLLRGRLFGSADDPESPKAAVVSERLASTLWPGLDPIGRELEFAWPWLAEEAWTVVGVVPEIRARALERTPAPQVWVLHRQTPGLSFHAPRDLAVRTDLPLSALAPEIRRVVHDVDPSQPLTDVRSLADLVHGETVDRRAQLRLVAAFAGLAFLVAALGVYALLSAAVVGMRHEIGVRRAVGAEGTDILGRVFVRAFRLATLGLVPGLAAALASTRLFRTFLHGVPAADPWALSVTALLLVGVALVAAVVPALRAVRVDPRVTLLGD